MKVSVYKREKGGLSVLLQATPGRGISPVILQDVSMENLRPLVSQELERMKRPEELEQVRF